MPFQSSLSLYQCTLLPICTVATVQLLYAIPNLTVTISVHTVTNMYGSHSTVTVYDSNPRCRYISAQLPICTVATAITAICQYCSTITVCESVGLLWTRDRPLRALYLTTRHSQQTDIHVPGVIRTRSPSRRMAADPHLGPRGHYDWDFWF